MGKRRSLVLVGLVLISAAAAPVLFAEKGYWRFMGERVVKGEPFRVGPNDPTKVEAAGGGSAINAVCTQKTWRSSGSFSWTVSGDFSRLSPGAKIKFSATLTHSGNGAANAGISLQPYGMEPGTGHVSGQSILAGFDNTSNRSTTRSTEFVVPEGPLFPDKRMEIRFEVYPGGASSALYRTYEWVPGGAPPPGKPPATEKPEEKKPAKPPQPPEKPDLHIDPDSIAMAFTAFENPDWSFATWGNYSRDLRTLHEPRADVQAITVRVTNRSNKVTAKQAVIEFYIQHKGGERQLTGEETLGDIPPGGHIDFKSLNEIPGPYVQATLTCRVYTPGMDDLNDEDNMAGVEFEIYWAAREDRAYSPILDGYGFKNYGWEEREGEELIEGVLATLLTGMRLDAHALQVMQRMWFPAAWLDFAYLSAGSLLGGIGGHCYGMSATSALYFEDPALRPVPKPTGDMTMPEASYNINLYQRAQLVPVFTAMIDQREAYKLFPDPTRCYRDVKEALRDRRQALILGFTNDPKPYVVEWGDGTKTVLPSDEPQGHAVLAYKLIEVAGRNPVIYVYDSNFPEAGWEEDDETQMTGIEINLGKNMWLAGQPYYGWASPKRVSAFRPHREMPLDAMSTRLINLIKEVYGNMIKTLDEANDLMAVLRCPADALFTDAQGRRTGILNGKVVKEIPGSKVVAKGEVEMVRLPENGSYNLTIRGTGKGKMGFDIIRASGPADARLVSFGGIPVEANAVFSGTIGRLGAMSALSGKAGPHGPLIIGAMKGGRATWEKAPAKFDIPAAPARTSFPAQKAGRAAKASTAAADFKPKSGLSGRPSGPAKADATQAVAERLDWSGTWATDFNKMVLTQRGNRVTGTYAFKDGRLEGVVEGDLLKGTWIQSNNSGSFEFRLSPDGKSFKGRWGYGQSVAQGGWNGARE